MRAYEDQSEEAFLTTQQVDEARHAQFFNRFYGEVLELDGTFESRLDRRAATSTRRSSSSSTAQLVKAQERLLANPGDLEAKVDFVVMYHMVIEGTLALTGQFFMQDYLEKQGRCPACSRATQRISQDEHRHVAYGTWFLSRRPPGPGAKPRITAKLMELIPIATGVLVPPGVETPTTTSCSASTLGDQPLRVLRAVPAPQGDRRPAGRGRRRVTSVS